MKEYRMIVAEIKERGNDHILRPMYSGHSSCANRKFLIGFLGLEQHDVEWYKLKDITDGEAIDITNKDITD